MAASMVPGQTNSAALVSNLGQTYSIINSSFKWHASCRHTHASVDGLLLIMEEHRLRAEDIESIVSNTYRSAIEILSRSEKAESVHQSKFSMGFVLAVAAKYGRATVLDFTEAALEDADLRAFQTRVRMELDEDIEAAFPDEWQARVVVTIKTGTSYTQFVPVAKGDPGRHLTR